MIRRWDTVRDIRGVLCVTTLTSLRTECHGVRSPSIDDKK